MRDVPWLKQLRERQAVSQRALAARSGVAQNTISQLERGERKAMPSTVRKLAEALDVEPSVLLGEALTPFELGVLTLLSQGQTNAQIAEKLLVSEGNVKIHIKNIMAKLGVSDRTRAAVYALQSGISEFGAAARTQAWEERRKLEAEREAEGRWAEYYVSGQAAAATEDDALVFDYGEDAPLVTKRDKDDYLRYTLLLPRMARQEERNIAWAKLDSGDLAEILDVAQETPRVIDEVLEELRNKQASFESIPHLYFEDHDAQHRMEKLHVALQRHQQEAGEAVQGLLELQREALHRLDTALNKMRKKGDELESLVHRASI
jgi:DNA-binding CsgD family transcriptional regulator/DNA-binding Xre family transcriptional regulator